MGNALVTAIETVRDLNVEAETIEATYGPNAYSAFLRQHHRRPDKATAATIGRLLGGRVRADDGSMQPSLTKVDKLALKAIRSRRKAFARRYDQIRNITLAVAALAENQDDPADVIGDGSLIALEAAQLDAALRWLTRFRQVWLAKGAA